MATKSSSRKTSAKKTASRAKTASSRTPAKTANACTVKECLEQHPILRFHATILGVLSLIVCLLVAIILISLT